MRREQLRHVPDLGTSPEHALEENTASNRETEPLTPEEVERRAEELGELLTARTEAARHARESWGGLTRQEREELKAKGNEATVAHFDALHLDPELGEFQEGVLTENENRIEELKRQPEVIAAHERLVEEARPHVLQAVRYEHLHRERDAVEQSLTKLRALFERIGRTPSALETKKLGELEDRHQELDKDIGELELSPEAVDLLRRLELRRLQRDLERYNFAETESRTELIREVLPDLLQGAPALFQGETGSGKSQLAKYISERYLHKSPVIISVSEQIKESQILGARGLEKGETVFNYSEFVRAQKEGRPTILDEINLMPHEFAGILHDLLQKRVGDVWVHPVTGEKIPIRAPIIATANLKSARYKQRYELDVATLRRFIGGAGAREIHYLDIGKKDKDGKLIAPETLNILAAVLADRRGYLPFTEEEAPQKFDELRRFVAACRKIQEDFTLSVREGSEDTLARTDRLAFRELVITLKDQIEIMKAWKASGFKEPLERVVLKEFFHKAEISGRAAKDRENMVRVFIGSKFFTQTPPEEFKIQGLETSTLRAWQGRG
jgi:energy-coupling factor transporter ATP-binding protein EcfA2